MRSSTSLSERHADTDVQPGTVLVALSAIFLLNILLRAFYLRFDFVNGDEGVRALFSDAEVFPMAVEGDPFWDKSRRELIEDLSGSRPRMILDVNGDLLNLPFEDVVEFFKSNYRLRESVGVDQNRPFIVYEMKNDQISDAGARGGTR
jgi:hypothetical protein